MPSNFKNVNWDVKRRTVGLLAVHIGTKSISALGMRDC